MEYNFSEIEQKWQKYWTDNKLYNVPNNSPKPKYYVLDMFPYPSGAGLHVGHPLGYIASDIYARYKRLKGFNVLHPMGYDSFGLPAEQYALETGQHPAETTAKNIDTFRQQLDKIGFSFDWDREVRTSDPAYYKHTQTIFLRIFNSWYNKQINKAETIDTLIAIFNAEGNKAHSCPGNKNIIFTAADWSEFDAAKQADILMQYRLAFSAIGEVNWCEALGTVLANDEVINGFSERGNHPVEKKKMRQWYLRITDYADRLLQGLETVDFSDAMKEMQRNWIGKSEGAEMFFPLAPASPQGEELHADNKGTFEIAKKNEKRFNDIKPNAPIQYEFAKGMRKDPTPAENVLWNELRNKLTGFKFRRQHPASNYILDFVCLESKVIIEADGGYHDNPEQKESDNQRDLHFQEFGYITLRFKNEAILNETEEVVAKIKLACEENLNKIKQSTTTSTISSSKLHTATSSSPLGEAGINAEANTATSISSSIPHTATSSSPLGEAGVRVYTTRPDTIFGVDFLVIAPEHEIVAAITTEDQKQKITEYLTYVKSRSDRERMAEVKQITGCFTGAYAINPFNGKQIPIWIAEYVLAGYGTGAIMAVPCGDQRDFSFAKHFNIPITNIIGNHFNGEEANPTKEATLENSDFLNGILMKDAIKIANDKLEELGLGKRKTNYRMRDAGFSRQRYWGEPFPIKWQNETAIAMAENEMPLHLPHVDKYGPGPNGQGPLANIETWVNIESSVAGSSPLGEAGVRRETSTMPGYAGSSWYFLRYMDAHNETEFCNRSASDYWNQVDLYVGGTEHAVGHLLYSRLWTKVLYDLDFIGFDEPYKKLLNQGMITGRSYFLSINAQGKIESYNKQQNENTFLRFKYGHQFVDGNNSISKQIFNEAILKYKQEITQDIIWEKDNEVEFVVLKEEAEKMSKSKFNVDNPDEVVAKYGADTFRMYEMFLGPVEQSKPWDTKGIEGVHRFLRKLWRLFYDDVKGAVWNNDAPSDAALKIINRTIKKIDDATEKFSYNTAVSAFMVCVNELTDAKCKSKMVLEQLLILLTPYAPHIAEELWQTLGNSTTILDATYPVYDAKYLVETTKEYPISINGKMRTTLNFALDAAQADIETEVLANEIVQKWLEGKAPKKIIFVKGKMVNVVI